MKEPITSKVTLLTITQASQLVDGLTPYRIRQLCLSGELPSFKSGNKWLIQEEVLLDYIRTPKNQKNGNTDSTGANKED